MILLTIAAFLIILGLLIFVHELGHFVMAKRAGMKVEEFGFGFPPRIFGIKKGETTYSINWIPLGGFVKIQGEDGGEESAADPRAFANKGFWPRFAVLIAGVTMNLLFAWFLLYLAFAFFGIPAQIDEGFNHSGVRDIGSEELTIVAVQPDSPAQAADFRTGDKILSVNGQTFENIESLIEYTKAQAGTETVYRLQRGDEVFESTVIPRVNPPEGAGAVGFLPAKVAIVKYNPLYALWISLASFLGRLAAILTAFWFLIKGLFGSGEVAGGLAGPVGIAVLTRDFLRLGAPYLIQFAAVLSINLAIINAVPFPALDGGRVLFLLIEKIRGVKSVKWEGVANAIGFALLILLMIVVTFRDIGQHSESFKRLIERFL